MKIKHLNVIILLIIFLSSFFIRINLNGIHLNSPGNVKASDPFQYLINTAHIADGGKVGTVPPYFAQGYPNVLDNVPQHIAVAVASLKIITGIEEWNLYYLFVCLLSSLSIVAFYLILQKLFSTEIALVASSFLILPFPVARWFYFIYIGMWPSAMIMAFVGAGFFVGILNLKKPNIKYSLFFGLILAAIYMTHSIEMILLFPLIAAQGYNALKTKNIRLILLNGFMIAFPVLLVFLASFPFIMLSRVIWAHDAGPGIEKGLSISPTLHAEYINFGDIHVVLLILASLGLLQMVLNYKKYWHIIAYSVYCLFIVHLLPYFVKGAYSFYLIRMRHVTIFFIAMFIAYFVGSNVLKYLKKAKFPIQVPIAILIVALIIIPFGEYNAMREQVSGSILTPERYTGFSWVQMNTPKDSEILFLGPSIQNEILYLKRIVYFFDWNLLNQMASTTEPELQYDQGQWMRLGLVSHVVSYTKLEDYIPRNIDVNTLDFDYVYFESLSEPLAKYNSDLANILIQDYGFKVVYNNDFVIILKNEKNN